MTDDEIVDMLRHIHNDVEILKKEMFLVEHKVNGIAYILHDINLGIEIGDKQVDNIVNPSLDILVEADRGYSAVDEKDKKEWDEVQKERLMLL